MDQRADFEGFAWRSNDDELAPAFSRLSADKRRLTIEPKGQTDFYNGFYQGKPLQRTNAPLYFTQVGSGDFTFSCRVDARLVGFGDAGALTVWASPDRWAKLCLERSPSGEVAIVSVVTNGYSDDANSELLTGRVGRRQRRGNDDHLEVVECIAASCELRISRSGNEFGMQYRLVGDDDIAKEPVAKDALENEEERADGSGEKTNPNKWRFVRSFIAEWMGDQVHVGVHAQAPFIGGCSAEFSRLSITPRPVADLRSGE